MDVERELLTLYRDPQLHDKPDLLMQRGGAYYSEAAINLLCGLFGDSTMFRSLMSATTGSSRSCQRTRSSRCLHT